MDAPEILTIREAAKYLNYSYNTIYNKREKWGFFKMEGCKGWRIKKSDLDLMIQTAQNTSRLGVWVGDKEKTCRSGKTKKVEYGKLISPHQTGNEFVALLTQVKKN
ncbi:helix-turn-helix domain-containing protein [Volucribacter amazonae]|uniref:helix-turn-helix domain-containing protein n=1 Tax=Volucribacter amazonae TaxID=256731 RepID=UPI0024431EEC|nr:helix-turn-helix domain-containing protein [Volucribacter amazonae]